MVLLTFPKGQVDDVVEFLNGVGVFVQAIHRYEDYDELLIINDEDSDVSVMEIETKTSNG